MKTHLLLAACISVSLALPLLAAQPSMASPMSTQDSAAATSHSASTSSADRTFVRQASAANLAEVALGKLALSQGTNSMVKTFGQRMVTDHAVANQKLNVIAHAQSATISEGPSPAATQEYANMKSLADAAFDHAYAKHVVQDHRAAITLFEMEVAQGTDRALRNYAGQTLPILKQHLRLALKLQQG